MCYIQLSLWGVPAVVVVGNTLSNECRESYYTIAHHLGNWSWKLERKEDAVVSKEPGQEKESPPEEVTKPESQNRPFVSVATSNQVQIGFDF